MFEKIKEFIKEHWEEIILVIGVILISLLSFAIGYITAKQEEKQPIQIEYESSNRWSRGIGPLFSLETFRKEK
jgi:predicted negative regulator of RcsB-dependent stress response